MDATTLSKIAIFISIVSATFTGLNYFLARKNRSLALIQEVRKQPKFIASNPENYRITVGDTTYLAAMLNIINNSENSNSLVNAELLIRFPGLNRKKLIRLTALTDTPPELKKYSTKLAIPTAISANNAARGWVIFEIKNKYLESSVTKKYDLHLHDVHSKTHALDNLMFMDGA